MTGIQFVTDEKGRKTAVLIDLKKHRAIWQDFWDGLVSEARRKEKSIHYGQYRARRARPHAYVKAIYTASLVSPWRAGFILRAAFAGLGGSGAEEPVGEFFA